MANNEKYEQINKDNSNVDEWFILIRYSYISKIVNTCL